MAKLNDASASQCEIRVWMKRRLRITLECMRDRGHIYQRAGYVYIDSSGNTLYGIDYGGFNRIVVDDSAGSTP